MLKLTASRSSLRRPSGAGRKSAIASRKTSWRLQLRHVGAARNDLQPRVGQAGGEFMRHRRRRRLVLLADQHQRRHLHLVKLGPQVELGQLRAGGAEHVLDRSAETPRGGRPSASGCAAWNSGANSRRIATSVMAASPLALEAAAMLRKASRPASENAAPQSAKTKRESRCRDGGSPSAARRSRHSRCRARSRPRRRRIRTASAMRSAIVGKTAAAPPASGRSPAVPARSRGRISQAPARSHRNSRDPTAASATETAACPLPVSAALTVPLANKPIHAGLLSLPQARCASRRLINQNAAYFKPWWLDVIFHDCKTDRHPTGNFDASA